jgi:hypothetical protein
MDEHESVASGHGLPRATAAPEGFVTRRSVFRLGAAAAAAVAAGVTVTGGARTALAGPTVVKTKGVPASNFRVTVDGAELKAARAVAIGAIRTNLSIVPGRPATLTYFGLESSTTIEIEAVADREEALADWYASVKGGAEDRRDVVVELLSANLKSVVRTYRAKQCILEEFAGTRLTGTADKLASDRYVLRCPLSDGAFSIEES